MAPFMDFLRHDDYILERDEDGATVENLPWVIQAAGQLQKCAYLMLVYITSLGYHQALTIPQEASVNPMLKAFI